MKPVGPKERWACSSLTSSQRLELCYELGWTLRSERWGQGYATEIGKAGLAFAFDELGAEEVVAFTERHNARFRAVMVRLNLAFIDDLLYEGEHFVLYALGARDYQTG